jgi:CubicO group peptidase (beta-lactamase class C family)
MSASPARLRPAPDLAGLSALLDDAVPEILAVTSTPGVGIAVGGVDGGRLTAGYGAADLAEGTPFTAATPVPMASMSKLYTATAALQCAEDGVLALDDAAAEHLGDLELNNPHGGRSPTIRDLLSFRSGLCDDNIDARAGAAAGTGLAAHVRAVFARNRQRAYGGLGDDGATRGLWVARTGEEYHYANFGIDVVGLIVERRNALGLDFAGYLRERVLSPLGIAPQALGGPRPGTASGYAKVGRLLTRTPWIATAGQPAAGLTLSAEEHLRWMLATLQGGTFDGRRLLGGDAVEAMLTPNPPVSRDGAPTTGLIAELYDDGPRHWFGELGGYPWGWVSDARAYPHHGLALVIATNRWDIGRGFPRRAETAHGLIAELVFEHVAAVREQRRHVTTWAWRRAYVHGLLLADRTYGVLGLEGGVPADEVERAATAFTLDGEAGDRLWDRAGFVAGFRDREACATSPSAVRELLRDAGVSHSEARLLFVEAGRRTGQVPIPSPAYAGPDPLVEDGE